MAKGTTCCCWQEVVSVRLSLWKSIWIWFGDKQVDQDQSSYAWPWWIRAWKSLYCDEYVPGKVYISSEVLMKYIIYILRILEQLKLWNTFISSALNALHIAIIAFNLVAFRISSTMAHGGWIFLTPYVIYS